MTIDQLEDWLPRLAAISPDQRTALPGVTPGRTYQIVGSFAGCWPARICFYFEYASIYFYNSGFDFGSGPQRGPSGSASGAGAAL